MSICPQPSSLLASAMFGLRALNSAQLPPTHGKLVHAAFLRAIQNLDPISSAILHAIGETGGFTLSTLERADEQLKRRGKVQKGDLFWLRVTSLDPQFSLWLLNSPLDHLSVSGLNFALEPPTPKQLEHPGARTTSWENLWNRFMNDGAFNDTQSVHHIHMNFDSPTAFRCDGGNPDRPFKRTIALPEPELIWGNLAQRWNRLAPSGYLLSYLEGISYGRWISVSKLGCLQTRSLLFKDLGRKWTEIGFMGACDFVIHKGAPSRLIQETRLLSAFAFYAGVGIKTRFGMGQVHCG